MSGLEVLAEQAQLLYEMCQGPKEIRQGLLVRGERGVALNGLLHNFVRSVWADLFYCFDSVSLSICWEGVGYGLSLGEKIEMGMLHGHNVRQVLRYIAEYGWYRRDRWADRDDWARELACVWLAAADADGHWRSTVA